jgi:hypothetical protein
VATEQGEDDGLGPGLGPIGDAEIDSIQTEQIGFDYSAKALATAGGFLEVVAIVAAAAVVLVGVGAALNTSTDLSGNQTHPDLGVGVAAIISGVIFGVFYWALARALRVLAGFARITAHTAAVQLQMDYQGESAREKECPDCFEDVWEQARVCRFCGYRWAPQLSSS